ncbi:DUF4089 domain-containing protein [Nodosilinea sp. LEGE 06152]|uniref:DUF4089 domain-containing protein n=1 Tax=Nodosilinea sp. LEGE 06152 TaxID=2777966 RepID=UPI00188036DD|nr:DUF4089 domain-containing protein [Nodosilinea sp. LEGE 06152]MBE9155694.1 DUF4089 domain-containing protein [Nodosilinea sp. LEGE 06152]
MSAEPSNSIDLSDYVDAIAPILDLTIPDEIKPGVVANMKHIWDVAQPVLTFPLPDTVESAATFEP